MIKTVKCFNGFATFKMFDSFCHMFNSHLRCLSLPQSIGLQRIAIPKRNKILLKRYKKDPSNPYSDGNPQTCFVMKGINLILLLYLAIPILGWGIQHWMGWQNQDFFVKPHNMVCGYPIHFLYNWTMMAFHLREKIPMVFCSLKFLIFFLHW